MSDWLLAGGAGFARTGRAASRRRFDAAGPSADPERGKKLLEVLAAAGLAADGLLLAEANQGFETLSAGFADELV
jgi:hypothetical protein